MNKIKITTSNQAKQIEDDITKVIQETYKKYNYPFKLLKISVSNEIITIYSSESVPLEILLELKNSIEDCKTIKIVPKIFNTKYDRYINENCVQLEIVIKNDVIYKEKEKTPLPLEDHIKNYVYYENTSCSFKEICNAFSENSIEEIKNVLDILVEKKLVDISLDYYSPSIPF